MAEPTDPFATLRADNARLRRLLDESGSHRGLRHGLRDTVAMLRGILRRSSESADDIETYVAHLEGRLDAIMRVHTVIDAFGEADLHALVADELLFHLAQEGERSLISGPAVRLRPKAAQVIALAVHELASNAVEHGALGTVDGRVSVTWDAERNPDDPALTLVWKESGGREPPAPRRRGFGTAVLKDTLAYEFGGRADLAFEPDGVRCTLHWPHVSRIGRLAEEADDPT